jgi:hypothetical protein
LEEARSADGRQWVSISPVSLVEGEEFEQILGVRSTTTDPPDSTSGPDPKKE